MSVKSAPYYWVECDSCGIPCEYDDFSAFAQESQAIDGAVEQEWSSHGDRHHCPMCPPLCGTCGQSAGDDHADRDGECQSCFDKWAAAERESGAAS